MARRTASAVGHLVGGGAVYLVLWLYGLLIDKSSTAHFVPVNSADDWLHLVLGLGMIALGVLGRRAGAAVDLDFYAGLSLMVMNRS
jgi:Domain of unknown function (DUF4383)